MKKLFLLAATMMFFISLVLMAQEPQESKKECSKKADTTKTCAKDTLTKK